MKFEEDIADENLGRWLAGELEGEELEKFEASSAFQTYQQIANHSSQLIAPNYNTELAYDKLKSKLDEKNKKGKVVKMPLLQKWSIAAGIAILIGVGISYFMNLDQLTSIQTAQGETKSIALPDLSEVNLNIASTISYDKENWENERAVNLSGEAYFKVSKGNRFVVTTNHGKIEVLGTEFNIRNRNEITEIVCYEGKVKVTDLNGTFKILTKGNVARLNNGTLDEKWTPKISEDAEWKMGSSSFQNVSLSTVVAELENQYGVRIECEQNIEERIYVGSFPHDNLEQALLLVFSPMQLNYKMKNDSVVVVD